MFSDTSAILSGVKPTTRHCFTDTYSSRKATMTAIWQNDESGWRLLSPSGFPSEADLHKLVEQAPHILPLAGGPQLTVLGTEVLLGGNYADLIAVEPSGRLAIIEIKLAKNAEARRAVIAQILTYAAFLKGLNVDTLERKILYKHLAARDYKGLADAVASSDQQGSFDEPEFTSNLRANLVQGAFRLVLVLDDAPDELVQLVGYLESVTDTLTIDLVTVSSYEIEGSQVVVPQRVDPELSTASAAMDSLASSTAASSDGQLVDGADDFEAAIANNPSDQQELLRRLTNWAKALAAKDFIKLETYHGKSGVLTLLPRLRADNAGLVTIYNENGPYLQFWRSVFERRAPNSLKRIEPLVAPVKVGQGTITRKIDDELLLALTDAYQEAASGHILMSIDD